MKLQLKAFAWAGMAMLGMAGQAAYGQALFSEDDFTSLIDTPIMQQPIVQGTAALLPMQSPQPGPARSVQPTPLTTSAQTRQLCDAAIAQVAGLQVSQAFELLAPYWPLLSDEIARLANQTQSQLLQLTGNYGPILDYEWMRSRTAGKSLVQHLYLIKMQPHALRFGCTFYQPAQTWQVHTVFWDDQIDALLEP